jgi:hypothetical protein
MELIRIDFEKGMLQTPKHTYFVSESLSVDRYIEFEQMQAAAAYGCTFQDIAKAWQDIKDALNKVKFVEAAAIIDNMQNALSAGAEKKNHVALRVCALFLNEVDEDTRTYKAEVIDAKINDWLESGVCYEDFFRLTVSLVPGLLAAYREILKNISGKMNVAE